ncbi:hypothetical protein [Pseudonocardia xinjiangensis]
MSSDTDHPRQRTVAELLAEHGDTGATGRRRRRRAADDVPGEEAAPPPPSSNGSGSFAAQWQPGEPDRSMLRERVPSPAQPASHRQPEREPQPWESAGEPRERRAREPQPWEAQPREQQPWEPQPREKQPWEPQSREPQPREPQPREPQSREPQSREPQSREPQSREPQPLAREPQPWEAQPRELPPPREPRAREPQPWEAQPREPLGRDPLQPRQRDQPAWQQGTREPLSREPLSREPLPRESQGREFPPREPQIRTPQPREPQPRDGRREAVAWESRPREAVAPPVPKPEPGRVVPPAPRPAERPGPANGRSPLDNPVREHPTQQMAPVRDGRPGVLDPLAPGRAASRRAGAPADLAPSGRPEYGAPAAGDRDSDDDGPPTEIGMAPVGAEAYHRDRTRERRGAPADDGGPPTEASAPVDFDDHPAGLGGVDLDDFHGDQDDDLEHDDPDGDQDQRAGRRQRAGMQKLADSAGQVWAAVVAQWIVGAIGGAALWVGFRFLWRSLPVVALAAAVLVTVGLVVVVRALLRNSDLRTTVFAVLVGLLLTVSPAILVLVGR